MNLVWNESKSVNPFEASVGASQGIVYSSEIDESKDSSVKEAIEQAVQKAISLLAVNIVDGSRYLLFEWDIVCSRLTVVVTDDLKKQDSPSVVECGFPRLNQKMQLALQNSKPEWDTEGKKQALKIREWISDYLITIEEFLRYALAASFHSEDRSKTVLL